MHIHTYHFPSLQLEGLKSKQIRPKKLQLQAKASHNKLTTTQNYTASNCLILLTFGSDNSDCASPLCVNSGKGHHCFP